MAEKSQRTASRREKFMKKINEGDKITRAMSFSKRQPTLKKKAEELKTLCAVTICMVCFGPDGTVETYPENAEEVKKEIRFFKGLHAMQKREFNLLGYLENVKGKLELKRQKVRRRKIEALTGSFSDQIEGLSGGDLLCFIEILEKKLMGLREKINLLSNIHGEKGKAIAHDSDNMDRACDYTVPEPIEATTNIAMVENKSAGSIVYEDLAEYFRDSELLKLAEFEYQPIIPDMRN
uniref:MADS-box domain-containing protein n=1 Tax=Salix viminalis TaxID=40686 RepID=A0A6N2LSV1_SALVM